MPAPNEITVTALNRLIGTPDCPLIVDVCVEDDFAADPFLIPGSMRHSHKDMSELITRLGGRDCIVFCQKGLKLSQGVVAWLQSEGVQAQYLRGGMYGWREAADTCRIPSKVHPGVGSLWVTRHRPKIDRIACPWLIRRFVDRNARFLFVAPSEVVAVAERFDAHAFDIEGVFWSHRGDHCTLDTMLDVWDLHMPALDRMALVVRAADTNRHELSPQASGLLALSVGLSRQYKNDQLQLEAGLSLYDALFRWARDGFDEQHDWPTGQDKKVGPA